MASLRSILLSTGLVALASAFTPPNFNDQTFGALLQPDLSNPVTQGQTFQVTWDTSKAATGETVSLVLCNGPGSNCVLQSSAIVEGLDATSGAYSWAVPCALPVGTQNTDSGYGMLIIVDGTGQFQYSTQFSVLAGSCGTTTTPPVPPMNHTSTTTTSGPVHTTPGWDAWNSTTTTSTTSKASTTAAPVWTTSQATTATVAPATTTAASPSTFTGAAAQNVLNSVGAVVVAGAAAFFAL